MKKFRMLGVIALFSTFVFSANSFARGGDCCVGSDCCVESSGCCEDESCCEESDCCDN